MVLPTNVLVVNVEKEKITVGALNVEVVMVLPDSVEYDPFDPNNVETVAVLPMILENESVLRLTVLPMILEKDTTDAFNVERVRVDSMVVLPNKDDMTAVDVMRVEVVNVLPRREDRNRVDMEIELPTIDDAVPLLLFSVDTERAVVISVLAERVE
jgi:hypothetical protein